MMKAQVMVHRVIVAILTIMSMIFGVQNISYGQPNVPTVTPGETNTSLKVSFTDFLYENEENAYQVQLRRKAPQGEWITKCSSIKIGGGLTGFFGLVYASSSGNYVMSAIFTDLEPGVTYEARYRDTNVSECTQNPPNPYPWSAIGEGTTDLVTPPRAEFVDANLALAIRRTLGLDMRGAHIELLKIPEANLDKLTQLKHASDLDTKEEWKISNLSGLEHATHLTTLSLKDQNISDLTPLAQLTQLTALDLSENNIRDITPLAQLTQLTKLSLAGFPSGNEVSDLTPLAQLTQLTTLDLSHNNNIRDLSPLSGLTHLTELNLSGNEIIDITPLAQLIRLAELNLWGNEISDITPLAQLTQLTELELTGNNISDITPLAQLTQLTELAIGFNNIGDITPLAQLTQLTTIWYRNYSDPFSASEIELLTVSPSQPLTSKSLNGSSVTLTLLPNGAAYDTSIDNIRNALTVSGISGVTVGEIVRMSDTELKVTFEFIDGLEEIAKLTISLEQGAVSGYEGRALTGAIDVFPELGLTVTSSQPLTVLSLDGGVVTLTLNGSTFARGVDAAITISGISGISLGRRAIKHVNDTVVTIELTFNGNIETDTILTFNLSAGAIEDYNGPPLTAEIPVSASTDGLTFTASTPYPLSAIILNGSVVTLKLSGGTFVSRANVEDALTISGITGITFGAYDFGWEENEVNWISNTEITFELRFRGSINADTKLIISIGPGAISGYNGSVLTAEMPVSTSTEVGVTGELVASTAFPLTKATLNGAVVILTLKNHKFRDPRGNSTYFSTSTSGVNISMPRIWRSGKKTLVRISFNGNLDTDDKLTIIVLPGSIYDYNGPPLAAELPVTVKTGQQVLVPSSERPPMYWINTDTDKIESVEPFDAVAQQVASLTVDTVGSKIYWSEHGSSSGTIKRANPDGTNVEVLVTRPTTPQSITVDTVGKKLYWINSLEGKIQSADLNGENISTVIQLDDTITHIAVDAEGSKLYWADSQFRIRRVNFDGRSMETPLVGWESHRTRGIGGIAIADGKIYWTERQIWSEYGGIIHRANLNGTNLETFVTSLGEPIGIAVDTDADKVYWTNSYGGIQRMDINGGEIENVVYGITAPGSLVLGTVSTQPTTPITPETPVTTDAVISISPASAASPAIGQQLEFSLNITGGEAVAGYQATVQFDGTALRYMSSAIGDYLSADAFPLPATASGNTVTLGATSLAGESAGDGTLATITFEVIAVKESALTLSDVLLSDSAGTGFRPQVEGGRIIESPQLQGDVNGDGIVNILDLVLVAGRFGQSGQDSADVNEDGIVNILDLVLVAGAFGNAAAPASDPRTLAMLTAADVGHWLAQAQTLDLTDATSQRGVLFLQQLFAALTPKATALLPNYPNPFNPETWIPYRLAQEAEVAITIYDISGALVRQLNLGHQAAGFYTEQTKAVYWDGRDQHGEGIASGLYFYTLRAGEFTATRKMLIMK